MASINKNYLSIRDGLDEAHNKYDHMDIPFGAELLTRPSMVSSSRSVMFGSHIKAHMALLKPDFPNCFTNYENIFGELSSAYNKVKHNYEVIAKVPRYSWNPNHMYTLIVYNKDDDRDRWMVDQREGNKEARRKEGRKGRKFTAEMAEEDRDPV